MGDIVTLNGIDFKITRSSKARAIRISIYPDCKVKVTAPSIVPEFIIKRFVSAKKGWITKKLEHFRKNPVSKERLLFRSLGREDYMANKDKALALARLGLERFNQHYKLSYKKITIRNQKSRWGSCSHNGNMSFNYKIVFLQPELQDYIIVHELCHIKELNHSKNFWNLVGEKISNYRELRMKLKHI
jgi:predicted metal-dependent hydrolase